MRCSPNRGGRIKIAVRTQEMWTSANSKKKNPGPFQTLPPMVLAPTHAKCCLRPCAANINVAPIARKVPISIRSYTDSALKTPSKRACHREPYSGEAYKWRVGEITARKGGIILKIRIVQNVLRRSFVATKYLS